jgi:hypothetical protein
MFHQFGTPWHSAVGSVPTSSRHTRTDVDRRSTCFKSWGRLVFRYMSALKANCLGDRSCRRTLYQHCQRQGLLGWVRPCLTRDGQPQASTVQALTAHTRWLVEKQRNNRVDGVSAEATRDTKGSNVGRERDTTRCYSRGCRFGIEEDMLEGVNTAIYASSRKDRRRLDHRVWLPLSDQRLMPRLIHQSMSRRTPPGASNNIATINDALSICR